MMDDHLYKATTLANIRTQQFWSKAVDLLAQCVATHQATLKPKQGATWGPSQFAASTRLYQIDRLVVKCREYYHIFRHRYEKLAASEDRLSRFELLQAQHACFLSYRSLVKLYALLKNTLAIRLDSETLVPQIHQLELHTITLGNAIRMLNQVVHPEDVSHLSEFQQDLIQALLHQPRPVPAYSPLQTPKALFSANEQLRLKANDIADSQSKALVEDIIFAYDALKKCYVISRKAIIQATLEDMGKDVVALTMEFLQVSPQQEKIFKYLQYLFLKIESLLFSAYRTDRCSMHLFEKAKKALQCLRKACVKHPIGYEYIQQYSLKRN